jgi:hypothetical protein
MHNFHITHHITDNWQKDELDNLYITQWILISSTITVSAIFDTKRKAGGGVKEKMQNWCNENVI